RLAVEGQERTVDVSEAEQEIVHPPVRRHELAEALLLPARQGAVDGDRRLPFVAAASVALLEAEAVEHGVPDLRRLHDTTSSCTGGRASGSPRTTSARCLIHRAVSATKRNVRHSRSPTS